MTTLGFNQQQCFAMRRACLSLLTQLRIAMFELRASNQSNGKPAAHSALIGNQSILRPQSGLQTDYRTTQIARLN